MNESCVELSVAAGNYDLCLAWEEEVVCLSQLSVVVQEPRIMEASVAWRHAPPLLLSFTSLNLFFTFQLITQSEGRQVPMGGGWLRGESPLLRE